MKTPYLHDFCYFLLREEPFRVHPEWPLVHKVLSFASGTDNIKSPRSIVDIEEVQGRVFVYEGSSVWFSQPLLHIMPWHRSVPFTLQSPTWLLLRSIAELLH